MPKHIKALDGLRGIAILLVLVHHLLQYRQDPSLLGRIINGVAGVGWSGVSLFFVLSGFLITGILFDSKGGENYFRNFYARRTLRIFPLYYLFVLLCTVVFPLWSVTAAAKPADSSWMWWCYLGNYHYAFHHSTSEGWLNAFWSLAVEEHFYLIWPAFVFLLNRVTLMRVAACCMVLGECCRAYFILHHNVYAPYVWTPCRMDDLALGALVALAVRGADGLAPIRRVAWVFAPLAGAVAIAITLCGLPDLLNQIVC
jgi:peptidoglycan/LPS O-acetylase OafA/YrhL